MQSPRPSADVRTCRSSLRHGSRSFHAAGRLLPRSVRDDLAAIYAFCRTADDLIDESGDGVAGLVEIRRALHRVYGATPNSGIERAFADVVLRHHIPRAIPEGLLNGFAWDVERRPCRTLSDVRAYSVRVAGTVGLMVTLALGRRQRSILARAVDLAVAMQLTNIARDVGEDARRGRLYLPLTWLNDTGVDVATWLHRPAATKPIRLAVRALLRHADKLYRRAESGIASLPSRCRPAIWAARWMYAAIGGTIAARNYDSVTARARTTAAHKTGLTLKALMSTVRPPSPMAGGPGPLELAETNDLLDAVCAPTGRPAGLQPASFLSISRSGSENASSIQ